VPTQPKDSSTGGLSLRGLTDPAQLRALAHRRRMDLIELLLVEGPLTATECATRLGDSPASCSYHLRQLARFGFVEEAPGGVGRQRLWRWVPMGNRIEPGSSPAQRAAGEQLAAVVDQRNAERVRRFRAGQDADPWRQLSISADWLIRITDTELRVLGEGIHALLAPLQQRTFDGAAPEGARLVDVITYLLPRPTGQRPGPGIQPAPPAGRRDA